jgi:N-acetylglucosaminyl-diphospho-decaprenol L-rhamnosyltransferase
MTLTPEPSRRELAIIIVSSNNGQWLPACFSSIRRHTGDIAIDLVVVDSGSTDDTEELVAAEPLARLITCENHGFAYANNRGIEATDTDWVLLLNPDTEIVAGSLAELVAHARSRPDLGVAGVRQVGADGSLQYTIRRFPSVLRSLGEALGSESWPVRGSLLGERVLDPEPYGLETACDWTSGSFMLIRRAALLEAGLLDERFFLYAEEPDLCLRIRRQGWSVVHLPTLTIIHHGGNESASPLHAAQRAYARRLLMEKHFSPPRRMLGVAAMALGYGLRAVAGGRRRADAPVKRANSRAALATLLRLRPPPFGRR